MVWHYAVNKRLNRYLESGTIEPIDYGIFEPVKPVVWLSTNPTWEPQGHGVLTAADGSSIVPGMRESDGMGYGLIRIGLDASAGQLTWDDLRAIPHFASSHEARFIEWSVQIGADPSQWRFATSAVAEALWLTIERWEPDQSQWVAETLAGHIFESAIREMFLAIDECMSADRVVASLILIYSTIDSLAWLGISDTTSDTTETAFCDWLDTYLLPFAFGIRCDAIDLYGARCGLLHTRSSISKKSRRGDAKQIMYAWAGQSREDLQKFLDIHPVEKAIAVRANDLFLELKAGFERFFSALRDSPAQAKMVRAKSERTFPSAAYARRKAQSVRSLGI